MLRSTLLATFLLMPVGVVAQVGVPSSEVPPSYSVVEEVALARSAAPAAMSGQATILVLEEGKYRVAHEGSNGVSCMVSRSLPLSSEPICYDPEASRSTMLMEMRRVEMRLAGLSADEVDGHIAEAILSGEIPLPTRPAIAYMMSAEQVLYADAETRVGAFRPHVHFYWPYATAEQFGALGASPSEAVIITDPGKPTASVIVFVAEFTGGDGSLR